MDELNQDGIFLLDIYLLDYYGIKVFFQVCKTTKNTVYLVELATKRTKQGIMLTKRIKPTKKPLIILKDNTYTKSQYEVNPVRLIQSECWLPIQIKYGDPIFREAERIMKYPACGYTYAVPIKDVINKYWKAPKKPKIEENVAMA